MQPDAKHSRRQGRNLDRDWIEIAIDSPDSELALIDHGLRARLDDVDLISVLVFLRVRPFLEPNCRVVIDGMQIAVVDVAHLVPHALQAEIHVDIFTLPSGVNFVVTANLCESFRPNGQTPSISSSWTELSVWQTLDQLVVGTKKYAREQSGFSKFIGNELSEVWSGEVVRINCDS